MKKIFMLTVPQLAALINAGPENTTAEMIEGANADLKGLGLKAFELVPEGTVAELLAEAKAGKADAELVSRLASAEAALVVAQEANTAAVAIANGLNAEKISLEAELQNAVSATGIALSSADAWKVKAVAYGAKADGDPDGVNDGKDSEIGAKGVDFSCQTDVDAAKARL